VERAIVGYRQDVDGDWIAELSCGHSRHVRHNPPLNNRPWTQDARARAEMLGALLECQLCRGVVDGLEKTNLG
jgi:hypothetical protein